MITFVFTKQQSGAALILTIIVLTVLLISSLALIRSSETATVVVGNIAFKQSASSAGDVGIQAAINALNAIVNKESNAGNIYYATQQPNDLDGIPSTANWDNVPIFQVENNNVQYVIDRLCTGPVPIANFNIQCSTGVFNQGGSNKSNATVFSNSPVYYRATIRVIGSRNSTAFIQAILRQ